MKTLLKVLGAAALVAGLTPYSVKKNEETSETTYQALLWKMTTRPNAEEETKKDYDLTIAFNPPAIKTKKSAEAEMFADHLMECESECECTCECDDSCTCECDDSCVCECSEEAAPVEEKAPETSES